MAGYWPSFFLHVYGPRWSRGPYYILKRTTMCSPIVGQFYVTMIVASSDKEWLALAVVDKKCWKLF